VIATGTNQNCKQKFTSRNVDMSFSELGDFENLGSAVEIMLKFTSVTELTIHDVIL
jgi:hypothetical protein